MRTAAFAIVMTIVAAAVGLYVIYGMGNAAGWVIVIAAVPWALVALNRITGGPKER
jgi:hypothetical protein